MSLLTPSILHAFFERAFLRTAYISEELMGGNRIQRAVSGGRMPEGSKGVGGAEVPSKSNSACFCLE